MGLYCPAKPFKKMGGKEDNDEGGGDFGDMGGGGGHGGGGGGGGLPDLDDLDDMGGDKEDKDGKDGKDKEDDGGDNGGDDKDKPDLKKLKEVVDDRDRGGRVDNRDRSDRDQTGEKKAPNITEDPLGALERSATEKKKSEGKVKSALSHNYEGGSPLRIGEHQTPVADKGLIGSLSDFLKKTQSETKKELLRENQSTGSKSMLDESGIL